MKSFETATRISGRGLILAVSLTLFVCLPTLAQVGKKGQVNPQPPVDAPKATVPAKKKTVTKSTSSVNRSRGNASTANNGTSSTASNKSLSQTLTLIKKSFESERPLPAAEGPVMTKNEAFEFDGCLIRAKTLVTGDTPGSYILIETIDLTDINSANITVTQYGQFERKSFNVTLNTLDGEEKIKRNWKYPSQDMEQTDKEVFLYFKEKNTADRVAKTFEQAVKLCRNQ
jgi:hypothetical protein